MLVQHLRRWASIDPPLTEHLIIAGNVVSLLHCVGIHGRNHPVLSRYQCEAEAKSASATTCTASTSDWRDQD